MKTITECQPLIYGMLLEQAQRRKVRQRKNVRLLRAAMPVAYSMLGLAIVFDAGIMPWDISFWLIFAPFFLFGESVLSAIAHSHSKSKVADTMTTVSAAAIEKAATMRKPPEVQKHKEPVRNTKNAADSSALVLSALRLRGNELLYGGVPTPDVAMRRHRVRSAASTARRRTLTVA